MRGLRLMGTYNETDEEQYFDIREDITSASNTGSDCSEGCCTSALAGYSLQYELWTKNLESIDERRERFFKWMDMRPDWPLSDGDETASIVSEDAIETVRARLREESETVLANVHRDDQFFSVRSSQSFRSNEALEFVEDGSVDENFACIIKNLDDGTVFVVDELGQDGTPSRLREVGSDKSMTFEQFQKKLGSSSLVQQFLRRDCEESEPLTNTKKVKRSWFRRLNVKANNMNGIKKVTSKPIANLDEEISIQRVKVNANRKHVKELSSLYRGQEFAAHEGSIRTIKFSPDGKYLASAGKDGVVRVWKVMEDEIPSKYNIQDTDSSCLYFSMKSFSQLAPLSLDNEKGQVKGLKKSSDSACVILPPKVFRMLEKPVHEFHGHGGEVLALSWSKNGQLLSSSVDKTARLWKVGCDGCQGVYSHNSYVTCIEFNPVNDNYFISGSIDGKLRIWEVRRCRVIDWTDVKEIVTAVCYSPDGKGGVVGFIDGHCHFYDIVDNHLQMRSQISLQGKKRLTQKRVTGFQFCPSDANKVMVTSADSQIRILSRENVICKFKGVRHSGSQVPASFTPDGRHVVSATDDSNIYVWNYANQDIDSSRAKKSVSSNENFYSRNASIAVPWCGLKTGSGTLPESILANGDCNEHSCQKTSASPDCFSLGLGHLVDSLYRGSATWPEEKLPSSSPVAVSPSIRKSEYKFLKNAWHSALSSPHLWGLVVVTGGWDGYIRTFLNYGLPIRF